MGQGRLISRNSIDDWPEELRQAATSMVEIDEWQPELFEMSNPGTEKNFKEFLHTTKIKTIVDNYDEQYAELIVSRQPQLYNAPQEAKKNILEVHLNKHYAARKPWQLGSWVYYPWSSALVHVLERELFLEARTIRNKNLITFEEQKKFANFNVACAGMSVGSNAAIALAIQGGSQKLKIADSAVISGSNLNRILTGVSNVGASKSLVVARQLYEMNPYLDIERYGENIAEDSVNGFFDKPWPVQVIVDEIDDLKMKILLRMEARKRGLPVLMATDIGDDVMLDVERFDLRPDLPLFHGLVKDVEQLLTREVPKREWMRHATTIVGIENAPLRMQQSLMQVGTKLVTQPQLGGTAMMAGVVVAYAVRQLALGEELKSGRTIVSLDKHLRPDLTTRKHLRARQRHAKQLKRLFDAK